MFVLLTTLMCRHRCPLIAVLLTLQACGGDPEEARQVDVPVVADASGLTPTTTNMGYSVELTEARLALENVLFLVAGEAHARAPWRRLLDVLVPSAHAHPGHYQGGEVTGELPGRWVVQWLPEATAELGVARLLVGSYQSANFRFTTASAEDGVASDDPLFGHTALLRGRAARDRAIDFLAVIDAPPERDLVGVPFEHDVRESADTALGLRWLTEDAVQAETLFDDVDFAALDADEDGQVTLAPGATDPLELAAYNTLRRAVLTHDHYDVRPTAHRE